MQTWFESKVKYVKVSGSGNEQQVTENFLLDAVSYTDAETRIIRKMHEMVKGGEFTIVDIKKSRIAEVFPFESGEWWFKATINLVTIDDEAGKDERERTNTTLGQSMGQGSTFLISSCSGIRIFLLDVIWRSRGIPMNKCSV